MIFKIKGDEAAEPEKEITWSLRLDSGGNLLVEADAQDVGPLLVAWVEKRSGLLIRPNSRECKLAQLGLPADTSGRIAEAEKAQ